MENDNDAYNKVDDLIMVDLQQPSVIVDQLGVVLEPRALESSLMMTDFSFASLSPSKCHFRDISSACSYNTWNGKSILSQTHNSPQLTAPKQTWTKLKYNVLKGKYNKQLFSQNKNSRSSLTQLLNGAICSLIISARGCSAFFPLVFTSSTWKEKQELFQRGYLTLGFFILNAGGFVFFIAPPIKDWVSSLPCETILYQISNFWD